MTIPIMTSRWQSLIKGCRWGTRKRKCPILRIRVHNHGFLSNNKISREIPDSIASLNGSQLLNLSNSMLTGQLHPSLGALTKLKALYLSQNELIGEIPQQLIYLTSLAVFNVSTRAYTTREAIWFVSKQLILGKSRATRRSTIEETWKSPATVTYNGKKHWESWRLWWAIRGLMESGCHKLCGYSYWSSHPAQDNYRPYKLVHKNLWSRTTEEG